MTHEDNMTIASKIKSRRQQMTWLRAVTATLLTVVLAMPVVAAQQAYLRVPHKASGTAQPVSLEVNKSILVDLPTNAGEVIVSQPSVATIVMRSKTRAIVQGISGGDTNIFFLDPAGNNIAVLDLKVVQAKSDLGTALESTLARVIRGSRIQVASLSDNSVDGKTHFVLTGTVLTAEDKAIAEQMAADISEGGEAKGSLIQVIGPQQVKLKVTVAEVARDTVKQLGINLDGSISVGPVALGLQSQPAIGGASGVANNNGATLGYDDGTFSLTASLRALERRGALRTLAEPTLTAFRASRLLSSPVANSPCQVGCRMARCPTRSRNSA